MIVRPSRRAFRPSRLLPALTAALLTAGLTSVVTPTTAQAAEPVKPLPAQHYKPVPIAKASKTRTPVAIDRAQAAAKVKRPAPVWPTAATADATLPAAAGLSGRVRAGDLPVLVAAPTGTTSKIRVSTLDRAAGARIGVDGLLMRVGTVTAAKPSPVEVSVEYGKFATAYGADWASRLRLVALPGCDLTTTCTPVELPTRNDVRTETASAQVQAVSTAGTLVALTSGPSGGAGDFTASDLKPSSTWGQSGSTGDFTWSYPLATPAPAGGPAPKLALSYSAQSVDGRTAASNNQPGPIGEGFDISQPFIERRYTTCSEDMGGSGANNTTKTGDLCWKTDNAILSMQGRSGELIKGSDGLWHPTADDGTKIERLTDLSTGNGDDDNEYWKVTTPDGTQYWFGRHQLPGWSAGRPVTNSVFTVPVFGNNTNEPCNKSTFAASSCAQAWRWNLDHVVDVNGNTMSYWYTREINKYARNAVTATPVDYVRGGYLTRIDYGTDNRDGTEYTATAPYTNAPDQVVFTNTDRCDSNCTTKNETTWPDTPWDLDCTVAPNVTNCLQGSPTFWTGKRITQIATKVGGAPIDSWALEQSWPDPGDGTRKGLWLKGITYSGLNGATVTYPSVTFSGIQMPNRVDSSGGDWALAMNWWRVNSIRNETGGEIFITYSPQDCVAGSRVPTVADQNHLRCFPVKWTPPGKTADITDYFHKYVVTDVQQIDHAGGSKPQLTHYEYRNPQNLALWHRDDDDGLVPAAKKSWSQWRGYPTVVTTVGATGEQTKTETLYYRGMHGDLLSGGGRRSVNVTDRDGGSAVDHPAFAGQPREQITWNGDKITEATVTDMWQSDATATRTIGDDTVESRYTGEGTARTRLALDGGAWQRTKTLAVYDEYGAIKQLADYGDEATGNDDRCTVTEYARNTTKPTWLLTPVKRVNQWAGSCTTAPTTEAQILSDTRYSFDTQDYGVVPSKGLVTTTETISGFDAGVRSYHIDSISKYDTQGRVTDTTDVTGANTHTDYTPAAGGPTTQKTVTNALSWATKTDYNARGLPTKVTDTNGRITEVDYDGGGRVISVWSPGRARATFPSAPSSSYTYQLVKADGNTVKDASVVTSKALDPNGNYRTSYKLYDGFVRERQTQATAYGAATPTEKIVTDTFYDSAGRLWKSNDKHAMPGLPTGKIKDGLSLDVDIPRQTVNLYDGSGRLTDVVQMSEGAEKWRTSTSHHGNHVDVTPPMGGTATSTWTDARGRTTAFREFHGRTPTGAYDETTLRYNTAGRLDQIQDASDNTWTFSYDIRGRKVRATDPDHGLSTTAYNAKDQVETVTDAENQTLAYTYDPIGRKTTVRDGSVTGNVRASWAYDTPVKGVTGSSTRNVRNADGTISAYVNTLVSVDAEYRPRQTRITIPAAEGALAGTYNTSYTYKADGSPATLTLPAAGGLTQETLTYEYDATYGTAARLKTNHAGAAYYINQATYTNLYEPSSLARSTQLSGAGFVSTARYYEASTGRVNKRSTTRSVGTAYITNAQINYDPAGNITKIDDNAAAGRDTQCFQYDHLRRLTEAWTPASADCGSLPTSADALGGPAPYWQSWQFGASDDPVGRVGNRLKQVDHVPAGDIITDYTYPAAGSALPHAVTGTSRTDSNGTVNSTYTYDRNGNTKTRPGSNGQQTLAWDPEGKLATITDPSANSSYLYDADGNRLISRDPTGSTVELGSTQLRLPKGASAATAIRYYGFNDEIIGQRDNTGLRWLASDHQGTSLAAVTADAGQTITQRRQKPYGETRGATTAWVNTKGFLNGQNDPTGLTHLGAREYDPGLGKFISVDPVQDITDPQQWNAYAYSNNSPITQSDPSGLRSDYYDTPTGNATAGPGVKRGGPSTPTFLEWYRDNVTKTTKEKASGSADVKKHQNSMRRPGARTMGGSITVYDRYGYAVFSDDFVRSGGGSLYYEDVPRFDAHVESRATQYLQDQGLIRPGDTIVIELDQPKKVCHNCRGVVKPDTKELGVKIVVKAPGMKPEVFGEENANTALRTDPVKPNTPRIDPDAAPETVQRSNGKPMIEAPGRGMSRAGGRVMGGAGAISLLADFYFVLFYGPCGLGSAGWEVYCMPPEGPNQF